MKRKVGLDENQVARVIQLIKDGLILDWVADDLHQTDPRITDYVVKRWLYKHGREYLKYTERNGHEFRMVWKAILHNPDVYKLHKELRPQWAGKK